MTALDDATLTCNVSDENVLLEWRQIGIPLEVDLSQYCIDVFCHTIVIPDISGSFQGIYRCFVVNDYEPIVTPVDIELIIIDSMLYLLVVHVYMYIHTGVLLCCTCIHTKMYM